MNPWEYVVIATFDKETDHVLLNMQNQLRNAGLGYALPKWRPHITFGVYKDMMQVELLNYVRDFTIDKKAIEFFGESARLNFPPDSF